MHIVSDIAYADERVVPLTVMDVRPLEGHRLWVRFSSGETRVFDFTPLLKMPAFAPLADEKIFSTVYVDYGVPTWNDGAIDIDPETLLHDGEAL